MQGSARSSKSKSSLKSKHAKRLNCERLEDRRMLAVVTVDTELDVVDINDGVTSLREAIFATNTVAGADEIVFDFDHDGPTTIFLTEGELQITDDLTINGLGADQLTIDAQQNSRIFNIDDGGVANDFDVTLVGMTLTGGQTLGNNDTSEDTTYNGGAIRSLTEGVLSINECAIVHNATNGDRAWGGAIYADTLILRDTEVSFNTTTGESAGAGGISAGRIELFQSAIIGNSTSGVSASGGGISAGRIELFQSAIIGNSTSGESAWGGGAVVGTLYAEESIIDSNRTFGEGAAGGGVFHYGSPFALISDDATLSSASTTQTAEEIILRGQVILINTTLSNNSTEGYGAPGGGVYVGHSNGIGLLNSTVSGNSTSGVLSSGGALFASSAPIRAYQTTITNNHTYHGSSQGGGVAGGISLFGSILAGNTAAVGVPDAQGSVTESFSLFGTGAEYLAPLADNGGPELPGGAALLTHALLPGSPAINAGDPTAIAGADGVPEFDQRGLPFERISSGRIDIGAYEVQELGDMNLVVDTLEDESDGDYSLGDLSLREAIELANANPGHYTIDFDPILAAPDGPLPATIFLTEGELQITDDLTINGLGADLLTIDASGNDPTPDENNGDGSRVFYVDDGDATHQIDVTIQGISLTGGDKSDAQFSRGGAIFSSESLLLDSVNVTNNAARAGGGIFILGEGASTTTIRHCSVSHNFSRSDSSSGVGAGIYFLMRDESQLEIVETQIIRNEGGKTGSGITGGAQDSSRVNIDSLTISENTITESLLPIEAAVHIYTSGNSSAAIRNSTISENNSPDADSNSKGGGAYIYVGGNTSMEMTGNTISGHNSGIAPGVVAIVDDNGRLAISFNTISNNSSVNATGGLIVNTSGTSQVNITSNSIVNNTGTIGGASLTAVGDSKLVFSQNVVMGNSADRDGGGVLAGAGDSAVLEIKASTIQENTAGRGAGVYVIDGPSSGSFSIDSSTVSRNIAERSGGGIYAAVRESSFSLRNSTVSDNSANQHGGGVYLYQSGSLTPSISHTTITNNTADTDSDSFGEGGGVFIRQGTFISDHSVIAGNTDNSGAAHDVAGVFNSNFSLIGYGAEYLAPLADNGGPELPGGAALLTHALLPGSPAINAGDPTAIAGADGVPEFDQRGLPFERISGGRIDIGAYEVQSTPSPDLNGDGYVDGLDLGILLGHWGQTASPSHGELNFTTPVDGEDLGILLSDWNPVTYLPEPAAVLAASSETQLADAALAWTLASETYAVEQPLVGPQQNVDPLPQDVALATLLPVESEFPERASLWIESDEEADEIDFADELLQRVFS